MAVSHTQPVDRAVPSTQRSQYYDDLIHATEVTVDFENDLGRPAKTGIITNNDTSPITIYLNHLKDVHGSMMGIPVAASETFSFSVYKIPVASIKITGTDVDVDIFVL